MRPVPDEPYEPLEALVGRLLVERKETLAIAESCTGGLIAHRLTNIPGSSTFMIAAVIPYAYQAQMSLLGLTAEMLARVGAVSEEAARASALAMRDKFSASLGLAVTGIAGPGGGTAAKPVGLTYIALAGSRQVLVERHLWNGDRIQNKEQSAQAALSLLKNYLTNVQSSDDLNS